MVYRIVHQKWLVQCANLMSSFLLVTEIHAFKVLPGPHTFALLGALISAWTRWERLRRSDMGPLDSPSKGPVQCANLMNLFLLVIEIHAFKVLPSHDYGPPHWSLLEADGWESEGRAWIHWVVHQKWPVQCANLINLFLLVIEIHAFKVLPSHMTMGHNTDL